MLKLTLAQAHFLKRFAENEERGLRHISSRSPSERKMAMTLVTREILATEDGYRFTRFDPDWPAFQTLLQRAFIDLLGSTEDRAAGLTRWCLEYALSDGQGGWNYLFKVSPLVWDAEFARLLANRYCEYHLGDGDR